MTDADYSWIKVPRFKDNPELSWGERFHALEAHHTQETEFLIAEVQRLRAEVSAAKAALSGISNAFRDDETDALRARWQALRDRIVLEEKQETRHGVLAAWRIVLAEMARLEAGEITPPGDPR